MRAGMDANLAPLFPKLPRCNRARCNFSSNQTTTPRCVHPFGAIPISVPDFSGLGDPMAGRRHPVHDRLYAWAIPVGARISSREIHGEPTRS